jgi:hypothetical protein
MWFGYIARLSQMGGGGYFTHSSDFYLPALLRKASVKNKVCCKPCRAEKCRKKANWKTREANCLPKRQMKERKDN